MFVGTSLSLFFRADVLPQNRIMVLLVICPAIYVIAFVEENIFPQLPLWFIYSIFQLFIVGVLWGSTNPFLKAATNEVKRNKTIISEVTDHLTNWHYLIPFLINQCGSLLFYFTLKYSDISLAVPIANGVSLVSTSIVGTLIGEEKPKLRSMVGILFLLFGIFCLIIDKKT